MSYTDKEWLRKCCNHLARFLLELDLMMWNLHHNLVRGSLFEMKRTLHNHFKLLPKKECLADSNWTKVLEEPRQKLPRMPCFYLNLQIAEDFLFLAPSEQEFNEALDEIFQSWEATCCGITPITEIKSFDPFFRPDIDGRRKETTKKTDVSSMHLFETDMVLGQEKFFIQRLISENFQATYEYVERFRPVLRIYGENMNVDPAEIIHEKDTKLFSEIFKQYNENIKKIEKIVEQQSLGIFCLRMEELKASILPKSREILLAIEQAIPRIGKGKVSSLAAEVETAHSYLKTEPRQNHEFVEYQSFLSNVMIKLKEMKEEMLYCKGLYELMEYYAVPIDEQDANEIQDLERSLTDLETTAEKKFQEKDELRDKLNEQIQRDTKMLVKEVTRIKNEALEPWLVEEGRDEMEAKLAQATFVGQIAECQKTAAECKQYQSDTKENSALEKVLHDIDMLQLLWECLDAWEASAIEEWYKANFHTLQYEAMREFVERHLINIGRLQKALPPNVIVQKLEVNIKSLDKKLPVIKALREPSLKDRHWEEIKGILGFSVGKDQAITLKTLDETDILSKAHELTEISARAKAEAELETLLLKVKGCWKSLEFGITVSDPETNVQRLKDLGNIYEILDESCVNIAGITNSKHMKPIKQEVDEWVTNFTLLQKILDEWWHCESRWVTLVSLFSIPDMHRQLPEVASLYNQVEKTYTSIMQSTAEDPHVLSCVRRPGLLESLSHCNLNIDQMMHHLEDYLSAKRTSFPRFYYLSNSELLKILSQGNNPHIVAEFIQKCFHAIAKIGFEDAENNVDSVRAVSNKYCQIVSTEVFAVVSPQGENMILHKRVKARGNVEYWLEKLQEILVQSLQKGVENMVGKLESQSLRDWILQEPVQILTISARVIWTKLISQVLCSNEKREDFATTQDKLEALRQSYSKMVDELVEKVRAIDQSYLSRGSASYIILVILNLRDAIATMLTKNVESERDFIWLRQLKYFWCETSKKCDLRMANVTHKYYYEYQGVPQRIVVTPITERCLLGLLTGLQSNFGAAVVGGPDTGKTETLKELACACGLQLIIFKTSDEADLKSVSNILAGIAQTGDWICFEGFSDLNERTASLIAQSVTTILMAKILRRRRQAAHTAGLDCVILWSTGGIIGEWGCCKLMLQGIKGFSLNGLEIKLRASCSISVTMNLSCYNRGHVTLPDNLKHLLRQVSIIKPDLDIILQGLLISEGFISWSVLAVRFTAVIEFCQRHFSERTQQCFGLRMVRRILNHTKRIRKEFVLEENEETILRMGIEKTIRAQMKSEDDVQVFQSVMTDIFSETTTSLENEQKWRERIKQVLVSFELEPEEVTVEKILELRESLQIQPATIISGSPGCGKTTLINVLKASLDKKNEESADSDKTAEKVTIHYVYTKSMLHAELFGSFNDRKTDWQDGLLGNLLRTASKNDVTGQHWIICNGQMDGKWIENLQTFLDSNGVLYLSNNERVAMSSKIRIIFEVEDTREASPAMISRCSLVHVNPSLRSPGSDNSSCVKSWVSKLMKKQVITSVKYQHFILDLFDRFMRPTFDFLSENCGTSSIIVSQPEISKVRAVCCLMEILLVDSKCCGGRPSITETSLRTCFIFAYMWGLGGNLDEELKRKFEIFICEQFRNFSEIRELSSNVKSLWDSYLDVKEKRFIEFSESPLDVKYDKSIPFSQLYVPNPRIASIMNVVEKLLSMDHPVLIYGPTGCGKTKLCSSLVQRMRETDLWTLQKIYFSRLTTSSHIRQSLERQLVKKEAKSLGAPGKRKMLFYIENVTAPAHQKDSDNQSLEFIRQLLDTCRLYDSKDFTTRRIVNFAVLATCTFSKGSLAALNGRFTRHFSVIEMPFMSKDTLKTIFTPILRGFFADFSKSIAEMAGNVADAAIEMFEKIKQTFKKILVAPNSLVFNVNCLSEVFQGMMLYEPGSNKQPSDIERLFVHESIRVYGDRLETLADKVELNKIFHEVCNKQFHNFSLHEIDSTILFTDLPLESQGSGRKDRNYQEIKDLPKLKQSLQENLFTYNITSDKKMDLILFPEFIQRICKLARMQRLKKPILLVGPRGNGKKSFVMFNAHLNDQKVEEIQLNDNGLIALKTTLQSCYNRVRMTNEDYVLLVTITDSNSDRVFDVLDHFVNNKTIPNLHTDGEYTGVTDATKLEDKEKARELGTGKSEDKSHSTSKIDNFSKVRLVLNLDCDAKVLGKMKREYYAVMKECVVCCMPSWPIEALESVGETFLIDFKLPHSENVAQVCSQVHKHMENLSQDVKTRHGIDFTVSGNDYMRFLELFGSLYKRKQAEIARLEERIGNGLKKLDETDSLIEEMEAKLVKLKPELKEKCEQTQVLLAGLVKEKALADEVRAVVNAEDLVVKRKVAETQSLVDEAQRDIDLAMPAVEASMKAIDGLTKSELDEVRLLTKPPNLVRLVMEAVCLLLNVKIDWASVKTVLTEPNFLKKLLDYDREHIPDLLLKKLKTYLDHPEFIPELVAAHSKFAKVMCMWVRAIDAYAKVTRMVESKRKKIDSSEKELNAVMSVLRSKQQKLAEIESRISKLEATYDKSLAFKANLEATIEQTTARLDRAKQLIAVLADERLQWTHSLELRQRSTHFLSGDTLIAAGYISYLSPIVADKRSFFIEEWKKYLSETSEDILCSENFQLPQIIGLQNEVHHTKSSQGLPQNCHFTDNSLIIKQINRQSLIFDPHDLAFIYIKQLEAENDLKIFKTTEFDFHQRVENVLEQNCSILITDFDPQVSSNLTWLKKMAIERSFNTPFNNRKTSNENKKQATLYVTTKVKTIARQLQSVFTLVDFSATKDDLTAVFLTDFMTLEYPDVEIEYNVLTMSAINDENNLCKLEEKVLQFLYTAEGNALDSEELVETFYDYKEKIGIIKLKLTDTVSAKSRVSSMREAYNPVAERVAQISLLCSTLSILNDAYNFSFGFFRQTFGSVVRTVKKSETSDYLSDLIHAVTLNTYNSVLKSLLVQHKILFGFMLCIAISKNVPPKQLEFILKEAPRQTTSDPTEEPHDKNFLKKYWFDVEYLATSFDVFKDLPARVKEIEVSVSEMDVIIFKNWSVPMTPLEKVMLVKCLKIEFLESALIDFIRTKLGKEYSDGFSATSQSLFKDSTNSVPIMLISTDNINPFKHIYIQAKNINFLDKVVPLTVQSETTAKEKIQLAKTKGEWVLFQSCHLNRLNMARIVTDFFSSNQERGKVHQDFRLFYSARSNSQIETAILQKSLVLSLDTAFCLKSILKDVFFNLEITVQKYFNEDVSWRQSMYNSALFHAALVDLGCWNRIYEFDVNDILNAINWQKQYAESKESAQIAQQIVKDILRYSYYDKITSAWDVILFEEVLDAVVSPCQMISERFACPESSLCTSLEHYLIFIKQLPDSKTIGLLNTDTSNLSLTSQQIMSNFEKLHIKMTNVPFECGSKQSSDLRHEKTVKIIEAVQILVRQENEIPTPSFENSSSVYLDRVLRKEIKEYNSLLQNMRKSIEALECSLMESEIVSKETQEIYDALGTDKIPHVWLKGRRFSRMHLGAWLSHVETSGCNIRNWVNRRNSCDGDRESYNLADFSSPRRFLAACEQTLAKRAHIWLPHSKLDYIPLVTSPKLPNQASREKLDELDQKGEILESEVVTKKESSSNSRICDEILIHGLYMKGAHFDKNENVVRENQLEVSFSEFPPIALRVVQKSSKIETFQNLFCFYTVSRKYDSDFITQIALPTDGEKNFWHLKNVFLLLETEGS